MAEPGTFGIDPGTTTSGVVIWVPSEKRAVWACPDMPNEEVRDGLLNVWKTHRIVCEWIQGMGMAVGQEVFETCRFIGRLQEIAEARGQQFCLVKRSTVKMRLCGNMRAKDPNIRRALLDMFGEVGVKKAPGPLYGVSGHAWSALAVAVAIDLPG